MVPERREEKLTGKDKKTAKIKRSQVIPRHESDKSCHKTDVET